MAFAGAKTSEQRRRNSSATVAADLTAVLGAIDDMDAAELRRECDTAGVAAPAGGDGYRREALKAHYQRLI